jgi:DNA (cytosine-5)-methyltransferase 1
MSNAPTVLDLFCGCGGLSIGFRRAGFDVAAAFDHWKPAVDTYARNLGNHIQAAEISDALAFPEATVIAGGPPCQGFSSAGLRKDDDHRNTLVGVFARIIAKAKPEAFVFENVEGFLTGGEGAYLFELLAPLIGAGYRIHLRKLNAAHYGVPQHRKRVIAIGGLGWDPSFPSPTHAAYGAPGATLGNMPTLPTSPSVLDAISDLPAARVRQGGSDDTTNDHLFAPLVDMDLVRAKKLKPGQCMRDLPKEYWHDSYSRRAFRRVMDGTPSARRGGAPSGVRRLRGDQPSKAITGAAMNEFLHPSEHRALTIRECARIQTFPDEFRFVGAPRDKMQLIGNAVPPVLAQIVASSLAKDLRARHRHRSSGALLSFVPTLSIGMSPVLRSVCASIQERFGEGAMNGVQHVLWH